MQAQQTNKNAMLVRLSISQWYNKALDKNAAREISAAFDSADTAGDMYVKQLLPKEAMHGVQRAIGRLRTAHYEMTLPWQDGGLRILPTAMYFEYVTRMGALKSAFETEVAKFLLAYPQFKHTAQQKKKALFSELDYPSTEDMERFFVVRIGFFPLPEASDFRLDLSQAEIEDISAHAAEGISEVLEEASKFLSSKLGGLLERYHKASSTKTKFHETTITGLYDFAQMVPSLNITKDEKLNLAAHRISQDLAPHSCDSIKNSPEVQLLVAKLSKEILDELQATP